MTFSDEWSFPNLEPTDAELYWLEAVYERMRAGQKVVPRLLKHELRKELPSDFDPEQIDRRLLMAETEPTLLGIWHADPDSEIISLTDRLLRLLRKKARTQVEVGKIDLEELADKWGVSLRELSTAYEVMPAGYTSGAHGSPDTAENERTLYTTISVTYEKCLERCAEYEGLEPEVDELVETIDPKEGIARPPTDIPIHDSNREVGSIRDIADEVGVNLPFISISSLGRFVKKVKSLFGRH